MSLYAPNLTDAGLEPLGRLGELRALRLSTRKITGAGLAHLRGLTRLNDLSLAGPRMSDDELMQLAALKDLRSLSLDVRGATWDVVGRLQRALPRASIGKSYTGP